MSNASVSTVSLPQARRTRFNRHLARSLVLRTLAHIETGGKVETREFDALHGQRTSENRIHIAGRRAETPHSRVHLQMNRRGSPQPLRGGGNTLQFAQR